MRCVRRVDVHGIAGQRRKVLGRARKIIGPRKNPSVSWPIRAPVRDRSTRPPVFSKADQMMRCSY
eukprot:scaffold4614_cov247-Pinguiococcus_pyrenoidosus.AAC.4